MMYTKYLSWTSLFVPAILIYTIGVLMVYDASSGEIMDVSSTRSEFGPFLKQLFWGVLSFGTATCLYRIGWRQLINQAWYIYFFLIILLILVFIPGIGVQANGARRWISFFGCSVQPSEFVKLFLPAFYLHYLSEKQAEVYTSFIGFLKMIGLVLLPIVLIALEPNNGTVGVIGLSVGLLLLATHIPWRYWLIPSAVLTVALFTFALGSSYVQSRFQAYKNPELDIKGKGHQPYQAKIAAGSGGLFGKGPARSLQKLSYLPEAQNDYIAAIYAEEFGFIGICALLGLYGWLIMSMAKQVVRLTDIQPFTWGLIMMFLMSLQVFMNLGVVSGLLPSTGLNLPLFSQGGSSLMMNAGALGILASMTKEFQESSTRESF